MQSRLPHRVLSVLIGVAIGALSLTMPSTSSADPAPVSETTISVPKSTHPDSVSVDGTPLEVRYARTHKASTFSMVALTWTSQVGTPAVAQFRTQSNNIWTAWTTMDSSDSETRGKVQGTDPYFTTAATGIEVRVLGTATTTLTNLTLRLFDPRALTRDAAVAQAPRAGGTRADSQRPKAGTLAGANYVPKPTFITRAQWGADESLRATNGADCVPANYDQTIKAVIVHHTAGSNNYTAAESARIVRGIYYYHVVSRGWCDIGYNALVDKYGQVFEGRYGGLEYPVHGAHATSWNTNTMGISVMMNSTTMTPTSASVTALVNVIAWKLAGNYRDATSKLTLAGKTINRISQHGDVMQTDCAGSGLEALLPAIRTSVAGVLAAYPATPIQKLWQSLGADAGTLGSPYIMERPYNGGRVTTFAKGTVWMTPLGETFWAATPLAQRYTTLGFATLGWPTANQQKLPFDEASYLPVSNGGALVSSAISTAWVQEPLWAYLMAHPSEFAALGAPLGEASLVDGVLKQEFAHGVASIVDGTVQLTNNTTPPPPVFPAGFGDRNGDGRADLVGVTPKGQLVTIMTTSALKAATPVPWANGYNNVNWLTQVPDLNGDSLTETLVRRTDGTLWLLTGRKDGGFNAPLLVGIGWSKMRNLAIMGDMTGDGRPDLLAIDAKNQLFRFSFTSPTTLTAKTLVGISWGSFRLTAGFSDFTGDGTPDLLAVNAAGELWDYSWQPKRNGWIWKKVGIGWGGISTLSVPGDVNGDGRVDLMGHWASSGYVQPYLSAPGGAWSRQPVWGTAKGYLALG